MQTQSFVSEFEWLASHGKQAGKFEGKWIAVFQNRIIAAADSLKKLLADPSVAKVRDFALVTRVPTQQDALIIPLGR